MQTKKEPAINSAFIDDWIKLAGIACLNPYSKIGPAIIAQIGETVFNMGEPHIFRRMIRAVVQIIAMTVMRYGLKEAFAVIHSLADLGRKILRDELVFGANSITGFRTTALKTLVHELLLVFDMLARQKMTVSGGELICDFEELWRADSNVGETYGKNARKFCLILLSYWLQMHKSHRRYFSEAQISGIDDNGLDVDGKKSLAHILYERPLTM